jgi:multiple sugar transport system permease protein
MKVTILYLLIVIPAEAFLGIAYALLVNSLTKYRRIVVTFILLPMSIVPVFLGALGRLLFHNIVGIVPYYLRLLGFPPPSLSDPIQALFIVAIMDIWQWTPFVFIIILAGLTSLPLSVIDAAKIDGAEGWKEFRYITFPMLKRVIAVALIFRIMDACKTFDIPFMLIEGGPGAPVGATTTISILVYKFALTYNNIGIAAASSILLLIILSIAISIIVRQIWRE